jgi:hypothetical protein
MRFQIFFVSTVVKLLHDAFISLFTFRRPTSLQRLAAHCEARRDIGPLPIDSEKLQDNHKCE